MIPKALCCIIILNKRGTIQKKISLTMSVSLCFSRTKILNILGRYYMAQYKIPRRDSYNGEHHHSFI